jgi:hypothetical protein
MQVKYEHEGLERVVKEVINVMYFSPGGIPSGSIYKGGYGGPVTMSERPY